MAPLLSIVGGLGFEQSKFNRATQAQRQPGSNFKPFVYSAALDAGFTAASIINDAPVVLQDQLAGRISGAPRTTVASSTAPLACAGP